MTDNINSPAHYIIGGIETIDVIQAKLTPEEFRGYCLGNVLKYTMRHGHKGEPLEDLLKGDYYLKRLIEITSQKTGKDLSKEELEALRKLEKYEKLLETK